MGSAKYCKIKKLLPYNLIRFIIIDYFTSRSQFAVFKSLKSDTLYSNTGVPQGTVLAPFYSICTRPIAIHLTNHVLSLNLPMTVLIVLIYDDNSLRYIDKINKFATHCKINFFELNVKKTKEMIIDF